MAAGTLPDAPDMRPSVTSATRNPRSCTEPRTGVSACSLGHAVGLGALKAQHADEIAVESAVAKRGLDLFLIVKHACRGLDDMVLRLDRRGLDHRLAEVAGQHGEPAGRLERIGSWPQDLLVQARARAVAPDQLAIDQHRLPGVAGQSVAGDGADVAVQQPGLQQLADHEAEPAGGVEMVHVGEAIGIDPRHQRRDGGKRRHVSPLDQHALRHGPSL